MSTRRSYLNQKQEATASQKAVAAFLGTILGFVLVVVCWNYGFTEVIQALGGPDANVNVLAGTLALMFTGGFGKIIAGKYGGVE